MKQISVTYKDPEVNGLVKSSVTVELNEDELEFVLRGLRSIHAYAAQNCGLAGQTPIEDCRLISDLYYALKYQYPTGWISMAYFPANLNSMNNQSSAAIDCLKSYLDFAGKIEERKEILATIEFLENILKYSYGEILEKLK